MAKSICGVIVSKMRSPKEAKKLSKSTKNCPRLVASGTTSNVNYSVYIVPEDKLWWLKYPEKNPSIIGAAKVQVQVVENLIYPLNFKPRLPEKKAETAPCGADCPTCHLREEYGCNGCPATVHYKGT